MNSKEMLFNEKNRLQNALIQSEQSYQYFCTPESKIESCINSNGDKEEKIFIEVKNLTMNQRMKYKELKQFYLEQQARLQVFKRLLLDKKRYEFFNEKGEIYRTIIPCDKIEIVNKLPKNFYINVASYYILCNEFMTYGDYKDLYTTSLFELLENNTKLQTEQEREMEIRDCYHEMYPDSYPLIRKK